MTHAAGLAIAGTLAAAQISAGSLNVHDQPYPAFVQRAALINATIPLIFAVPVTAPQVLP